MRIEYVVAGVAGVRTRERRQAHMQILGRHEALQQQVRQPGLAVVIADGEVLLPGIVQRTLQLETGLRLPRSEDRILSVEFAVDRIARRPIRAAEVRVLEGR